jgi:hypothetical protein
MACKLLLFPAITPSWRRNRRWSPAGSSGTIAVMRRRVTWSLTVPVLIAAELFAHGLAYRIAEPNAAARAVLLQETGHGYMSYLDLALAVCLAAAAAALVRRTLGAWRGSPEGLLPPWRLALLTPLFFLLQEYTERLVHDGRVVPGTVLERPVLIGLALQVGAGLAAIRVARTLLRLAARAGRVLALATAPPRLRAPFRPQLRADVAERPRLLALAGQAAGRAPPHPA